MARNCLSLAKKFSIRLARLVEVTVIVAADLAVGLGWDHHGLPGARERIDDALLGVECLVADQRIGLHSRQQVVGSHEVMGLTTGQVERDGIAEGIDQGVDFGARSSA